MLRIENFGRKMNIRCYLQVSITNPLRLMSSRLSSKYFYKTFIIYALCRSLIKYRFHTSQFLIIIINGGTANKFYISELWSKIEKTLFYG